MLDLAFTAWVDQLASNPPESTYLCLPALGLQACVYHSLHSFGTDLTRMMEELRNGRHVYRKARVGGRLYALMEMHKWAGNSDSHQGGWFRAREGKLANHDRSL